MIVNGFARYADVVDRFLACLSASFTPLVQFWPQT